MYAAIDRSRPSHEGRVFSIRALRVQGLYGRNGKAVAGGGGGGRGGVTGCIIVTDAVAGGPRKGPIAVATCYRARE